MPQTKDAPPADLVDKALADVRTAKATVDADVTQLAQDLAGLGATTNVYNGDVAKLAKDRDDYQAKLDNFHAIISQMFVPPTVIPPVAPPPPTPSVNPTPVPVVPAA